MYLATYNGQQIWKKTEIKKRKKVFAIHAFDTAATLKKFKVIRSDTNWQTLLTKVIMMQSIKDFAYIVSDNTRTLVFCQTRKHVSYLPWIQTGIKKKRKKEKWNMCNLVNVLNSSITFQPNWGKKKKHKKRNKTIIHVVLTWTYTQGKRKWHKLVNLNEWYHHTC